MAMVSLHRRRPQPEGTGAQQRRHRLNRLALVAAVVSMLLVGLGVALQGSSPAWVLPPLALCVWAVVLLRR